VGKKNQGDEGGTEEAVPTDLDTAPEYEEASLDPENQDEGRPYSGVSEPDNEAEGRPYSGV
jgi:hypothetical protein